MVLSPFLNPNIPVPNNPFYSDPIFTVQGAYYPIAIGSGLNFNPITSILTSSGGGGSGVTSIAAGPGISVTASTGNVTISNTGITSIVAGSGISVSTVGGVSTITNPNNGTVTRINTGAGLTGGSITSIGTISLEDTAVFPGSYSNPTLTIDAQGRITAASGGTALQSLTANLPLTITAGVNPTIAINPATTSASGAVLLSDSTASTSSSTAATSNAVKTAFDAAVAAIPKSCITGKGALISGTGASIPAALTVGTDGQVLTADSNCATGLKWAPGGGSGTVTSIVAGTGLTGGTINTSGTIALNTACVVQPTAYTAKGTLLSASAPSTPSALGVGTNGQVLTACSACTTGLTWAAAGGTGTVTSITAGPGLTGGTINISGTVALDTSCVIQPSILTAKGSLISASAASTPTALGVGADGQVLTACTACATGLTWAAGGGAVARATTSVTTASIVNNGIANVSITIPATYALLKIQTSDAAWVTLYTDTASRTADASRTEFTDPLPGTGVIAEVITSGATTQLISPGTIGFSSDGTNTSYAKIVNKSGATAAITVTLTYVKLEG